MKTMQYTYNFEPEMYRYILSTNILNKKKDEDKIFRALVEGYNSEEISKKTHYCQSTIWNRRRDIYNKTKKYMIDFITDEEKERLLNDKTFKVYKLKFPNNKIYVGMTCNEIARWDNGNGYKENTDMFQDIINYGWNNIEKEILFIGLSFKEAREKEKEMIKKYDSTNKKNGYNKII